MNGQSIHSLTALPHVDTHYQYLSFFNTAHSRNEFATFRNGFWHTLLLACLASTENAKDQTLRAPERR